MNQTQYHHGNLRQALITQAGEVLERRGAAAITFRGLARELGVSHAAPGHHFADRSELLAELAADGYAGLADSLEEAMSANAVEDWWSASGRAYIRFGLRNPERYRMMFASRLMTAEDCPERLRAESSRAYLLLLQTAYGVVPDVDPATYTMGAPELYTWSLVHGAVMLFVDGQLGTVDEAEFTALIDRILAANSPGRSG